MELKCGYSVALDPVERHFAYVRKHAIGHLELDLLRPACALERFTPARAAAIKKDAARLKATLSLHVPYVVDLAARIEIVRRATIEYIKKVVRLGKRLGVTHVTVHIGVCHGNRSDKRQYRAARARVIAALRRITAEAARCRVKIALENSSPARPGSGFISIGDNPADLSFIFRKIRSPWLNLCLDLGHAHLAGGAGPFIKKFPLKIICVHYHDNRGERDEHLDIGEGRIDFRAVLARLRKTGFKGPYVSETFNKLRPHQTRARLLKLF